MLGKERRQRKQREEDDEESKQKISTQPRCRECLILC